MMKFLETFLFALNFISLLGALASFAFTIYAEIMGRKDAERLLKKTKIPWGYKTVTIVGLVNFVIMLFLFNLRKELFGAY